MATHIGIGFSQAPNSERAAEEASLQAKTKLMTAEAQFILVLATAHYKLDQAIIPIQQIFDRAKIIGTSTDGIILSSQIAQRGLAILALSSEEIKTGIGLSENIAGENSYQAATILAQNSLKDLGSYRRQTFLTFIDPIIKENTIFLKGLEEVLGNAFLIVGSTSSDKGSQLYQNNVLTQAAVGLLLGGFSAVGMSARHGWHPLGKPRFITKTVKNKILQIDGERASHFYEEFLGDKLNELRPSSTNPSGSFYPLGILQEDHQAFLIRNVIDIQDDGSILCQGDIPEGTLGAEVHLMMGNKNHCQQATLEAIQEIQKNILGRIPKLIIVIEDRARLKLLGRLAFQEIELIKKSFGATIPLIGLYSDGQISPVAENVGVKKLQYQNGNIIILALC